VRVVVSDHATHRAAIIGAGTERKSFAGEAKRREGTEKAHRRRSMTPKRSANSFKEVSNDKGHFTVHRPLSQR